MPITLFSQVKPNEPKNVAIFLYDGVELLDFAGPGEVFSAAGFKTFTMSVDGKEITSQGFVKVQPEFSIETAPRPDLIVFPGGGTGPTSRNEKVITWIKNLNGEGTMLMSVCTGAFILANSGLLENKRVTTYWNAIPGLRAALPNSIVLENTRFVDNGSIITTAGVSAGIDGALHFVSRLQGLDEAKKTARYMEYDKWNPENGIVDMKNEFLENLLKTDMKNEKTVSYSKNDLGAMTAPYVGEFLNATTSLIEKGEFALAEHVVNEGIQIYPNSASLHEKKAIVYRKTGKPAPSSASRFSTLADEGKIDEAITLFSKERNEFPKWILLSEGQINDIGYKILYRKKDTEGAIKIFRLNTEIFPQSSNAFDSLGEAYLQAGNKSAAAANYRKSLALDKNNASAIKALATIESK